MDKIVFADGEKIGVIKEGGVSYFESEAVARYKRYVETKKKSDAWKVSGEGAQFRGDEAREEAVFAYINGVDWDGDKIVYAFTVNGSSGVYRKPQDDKAPEEHIFSSADTEILSVHVSGGLAAVTVRSDDVTSAIGTLDLRSSELKTLTGGDSRDANAFCSGGALLFDSAGVGRTANGEFSGKYAPSAIYSIDRDTLALEELASDKKYGFVRPKAYGGVRYCIRRPEKKGGGGSLIADIFLFPFRLIKAFFGMLQAFTVIFGNTSLTSDTGTGNNPTKGRSQSMRELYVDGKRVEAEKEQKRNKKFKDREYGFIPESWKLIRADSGEVLASGVCDYAFGDDGALYYTDGRHIFRQKDGKTQKLADCACCLSLAVQRGTAEKDGEFF